MNSWTAFFPNWPWVIDNIIIIFYSSLLTAQSLATFSYPVIGQMIQLHPALFFSLVEVIHSKALNEGYQNLLVSSFSI